jgi:hypothetical protein
MNFIALLDILCYQSLVIHHDHSEEIWQGNILTRYREARVPSPNVS